MILDLMRLPTNFRRGYLRYPAVLYAYIRIYQEAGKWYPSALNPEDIGKAGIVQLPDQSELVKECRYFLGMAPLPNKNSRTGTEIQTRYDSPQVRQFSEDCRQRAGAYFNRPAYLRNAPMFQRIRANEHSREMLNGCWHVDHLHQISVMLLLSEVTQETTHMEYAWGSHRKLRLEGTYDHHDVTSHFETVSLVGSAGTAFIYDTAGLHRAVYVPGTLREILHLNFTTGHDLDKDML